MKRTLWITEILGLILSLNLVRSSTVAKTQAQSEVEPAKGVRLVTRHSRRAIPEAKATVELTIPYLERKQDRPLEWFNSAVDAFVKGRLYHFEAGVQDLPDEPSFSQGEAGLSIDYELIASAPKFIAILLEAHEFYPGMAHPIHEAQVLNYDLERGELLSLSALFKPGANYIEAIAAFIAARLREERELEVSDLPPGIVATAENYRHWNITPTGLVITFEHYQVGPYSDGTPRFTVPWSVLGKILRADGPAAAFYPPP